MIAIRILIAILLLLTSCGVRIGPEKTTAVIMNRCLVCGDLLVGEGYCSTCNFWYEMIEVPSEEVLQNRQ